MPTYSETATEFISSQSFPQFYQNWVAATICMSDDFREDRDAAKHNLEESLGTTLFTHSFRDEDDFYRESEFILEDWADDGDTAVALGNHNEPNDVWGQVAQHCWDLAVATNWHQ